MHRILDQLDATSVPTLNVEVYSEMPELFQIPWCNVVPHARSTPIHNIVANRHIAETFWFQSPYKD